MASAGSALILPCSLCAVAVGLSLFLASDYLRELRLEQQLAQLTSAEREKQQLRQQCGLGNWGQQSCLGQPAKAWAGLGIVACCALLCFQPCPAEFQPYLPPEADCEGRQV